MRELKPCPKCGHKAKYEMTHSFFDEKIHNHNIKCCDCGFMVEDHELNPELDEIEDLRLIAEWNNIERKIKMNNKKVLDYNVSEKWYVVLPENKVKQLITEVMIISYTQKTITFHLLKEIRWNVIETYVRDKVKFIEKSKTKAVL